MNDTRGVWPDSRLDDTIRNITERLRTLEKVDVTLATLDLRLTDLAHDTHVSVKELHDLRQTVQDRREQDRKDRQQDRRWLIGTTVTGSGMVIAALATILSVFQT